MPSQFLFRRTPLLSVIKFDREQGEHIFLTYTHGREHGPIIERSGKGSPTMESVYPRYPGETTTDPWGQRFGTWLIQEDLRDEDRDLAREELQRARVELDRLQAELDEVRKSGNSPARVRELQDQIELLLNRAEVLERYLAENPRLPAHDREFINVYLDHEIVGQQGCGDLTMNLWNVGYVNSPLAPGGKPVLIFSHKEPLSRRTYSCFVKWKACSVDWKPQSGQQPELEIEDVRFDPNVEDTNKMVWVRRGGQWTACGDWVEFAFSNQQVIRDGKIVDVSRSAYEFGDLRHLLKMANLNPNLELFPGDPGRPRFYFGRQTFDDVWFGEAQLIQDRNLQRAAMWGPVFLSRLYEGLGASVEQVRAAMTGKYGGYTEVDDPRQDLQQGEFRFVPEDDTIVEVYLKRARYRWSMIGLDETGDTIYGLACEGNPGLGLGHVLEQAGRELVSAGVHNALLVDEGQDVFQKVLLGHSETKKVKVAGGGELDMTVELKRTRLRATLIFARRKSSQG